MVRLMLAFCSCLFFFFAEGQTAKKLEKWLAQVPAVRGEMKEASFAHAALSKKEAAKATRLLLEDMYKQEELALKDGWNNKLFIHDNDTLRFEYKVFGVQPADGRRLFISMHGGGNTRPAVNDQQWRNQVRLYNPEEGIYLAPRAPTNTWNLWHESHIDTLFEKLILAAVLFGKVSPDKVYIMGYSAGGDGVYQLATRMADKWAAAAMMAGHPNETTPANLRNIGFTLHMGALDSSYKRNEIAGKWAMMLDSLQQSDPGGYKHFVQLHAGRPHWMNREDTVALPWMAAFRRNPLPTKINWKQDDVNRLSFYWLAAPAGAVKTGGEIITSVSGNVVSVERNYSDTLLLRFNDKLVNLGKPVIINVQGKEIFRGKLKRSLPVIYKTIQERKDPGLVFSAEVVIVNGKVVS